jgi:NAD(P)-dependent dehydrogenase (short-subunit alcohol dehydrogenase family)
LASTSTDDAPAGIATARVALVTGASRGIGAAVARRLASQGYAVCINYVADERSANSVRDEVAATGVEAIAVQADVSEERGVEKLFAAVDDRLGLLSLLVNNAAIVMPQTRVEAMTAERIDRVLKTNVTSAFLCAREAVRRMSTRHGGSGGSIVNVSSAASRIGSANEYVDYAASKGAIDTLTRGLAIEVAGEGIRVNCVRPGFIYTDMHASAGEPGRVDRLKPNIPLQRGGTPEEIANVICWLASDEAAYCTGAFIDCAGGR